MFRVHVITVVRIGVGYQSLNFHFGDGRPPSRYGGQGTMCSQKHRGSVEPKFTARLLARQGLTTLFCC